jgi:hypothetical protein
MGINEPDNGGGVLGAGPFGCTTVLNPDDGTVVLNQIGPCNALGYGISIF